MTLATKFHQIGAAVSQASFGLEGAMLRPSCLLSASCHEQPGGRISPCPPGIHPEEVDVIRLMDPAVARVLDTLDEVEELNTSLRRIAAPATAATAGTIALGEIVSHAALPAQIISEVCHV